MQIFIYSNDTVTCDRLREAFSNLPGYSLLIESVIHPESPELPADTDVVVCDLDMDGTSLLLPAVMARGIPMIAVKEPPFDSDNHPPVLQIIEKPVTNRETAQLLQIVNGLAGIRDILRASRFQRQLLDSIPDIVMVIDQSYRVIRTNRAMLLHLSLPLNTIDSQAFRSVLGKKCHQIMFNRTLPCHAFGDRCPMTDILSSGSGLSESVVSCNGRHYQLTMTPLREPDDTSVLCVEVIRDITIQQRAAEAMETRAAFEQAIARACADLIVDAEIETIMEGIAPAMDRMADFIHADRWYLLERNDSGKAWDILYLQRSEKARKTGTLDAFDPSLLSDWSLFREHVQSEFCCLHIPDHGKESSTVPSYPDREGLNGLILMPLLIGSDFTRILGFETSCNRFDWSPDIPVIFRVFAEALNNAVERNRNALNLRREEERYRRLTDNLPDLIWRIRATGELEYVNPAVQSILGYSREDVTGSIISRYMSQSSLRRIMRFLSRLATGETSERFIHLQVKMRHRDGRLIPCEMGMTVDRDASGHVIALEGILRDLSEFRRAEREKSELQKRFYQIQRFETIGSMASGLAHEINNPIGIIIGFSEFLMDSADMKEEQIENIRLIHQEAVRIKELTQRLLDFARAGDFEMKRMDILKPVTECIKLILHAFKRSNIEIRTRFAADLPEIMGNPNALKQVIMNLLINAKESIPKEIRGVIDLSIERSALSGAPAVRITISDNGIGIPEEIKDRIFDPFFSRKTNGSGLGLSISAAIVESHHGSLTCRSIAGTGTTFILDLPVSHEIQVNPGEVIDHG